ncbi:hypothetical protein L596_026828 [Steinernema carpocapsae]|uniref:7TM GPCR serpentine receptor class x (Srx) domain-containing protein n=1 Tax=Steinernema carpocapsae TaxID=34508 RepID=A0A4U5M2H6_STECR|nr:hypothetical protein L596_026828 [Steinernema carpocapsae]
MLRKTYFVNSCYKLMFLVGLNDVLTIVASCLITGYLMIKGTVFCTHPTLQYVTGSIGISLWAGQCVSCVALALNRCLDFWSPRLSEFLFDGRRTYIHYALIGAVITYIIVFTKPATLSSEIYMWLYDPYILLPQELVDHSVYTNLAHDLMTYICIPSLFVLYTFLIISIRVKSKGLSSQNTAQLKVAEATFDQLTNNSHVSDSLASGPYLFLKFLRRNAVPC